MDGVVEEDGVLWDDADDGSQGVDFEVTYVDAVVGHHPRLHVVQTHQQTQHRRLSRSR